MNGFEITIAIDRPVEPVCARDLRERKSPTCEHVHRLRGHLELR
jgi:hypothetical protein